MSTTRSLHLLSYNFVVYLIAAVLLMGGPLLASEFNQNAIRSLHFEIDPVNSTVLNVQSANGDIIITGMDTDRVVVDAEIHVSGRTNEACEELANRVRIEGVRNGSQLTINPDLPRKIGYGISISYTIQMPERLGVNLETANGELTVTNCRGDFTAEATNGSISATNITGNVSASSVNGSIYLSKITAKKVTAETINGIIDCQCESEAPEAIEISTVNGSIVVVLPRGVNAALSADTVNGGLNISTGQGQITSKTRGSVEMMIGNGSGKYELGSVNGSIEVVVSNPPD